MWNKIKKEYMIVNLNHSLQNKVVVNYSIFHLQQYKSNEILSFRRELEK